MKEKERETKRGAESVKVFILEKDKSFLQSLEKRENFQRIIFSSAKGKLSRKDDTSCSEKLFRDIQGICKE